MTKSNEQPSQGTQAPEGQASQDNALAIALATIKAQQDMIIANLQAELAKAMEQIDSHEKRLSESESKELVEQMAPTPRLDETVKGGRYIVGQTMENPRGILVDANGNPVKE